jgi:hypothetical protein
MVWGIQVTSRQSITPFLEELTKRPSPNSAELVTVVAVLAQARVTEGAIAS